MEVIKIEVTHLIKLDSVAMTLLSSLIGGKEAKAPAPKEPKEPAEASAAEKPEEPAESTEAEKPAPPKEKVDMRAEARKAMDDMRKRFMGEDFENAESEAYKKWHKPIVKWFKDVAAEFGSPNRKPSTIPEEKIQAFIDFCSQAKPGPMDTIEIDTPF